jgi:putative phosphoesterase
MPSQVARIALLGDVHANLPALEAVLTHAGNQGAEAIWNIGDFVGYGAFPNEVVKRLRKVKATSIIGNYDLKVLNFPKKDKKWRKKKHPMKWMAFKWTYDHLSVKSREYLRSLPGEKWLKIGGRNFLLVHGSPASNEELLEPDTSEERLRVLSHLAQEKRGLCVNAIICGHSHQAFTHQVHETWFINTGSVGRPDDGDPRACYAILDISPDGLQISHYRLDYDVEKAVSAIREKGLPEAFAQMTIQGRDLDTVLNNWSS